MTFKIINPSHSLDDRKAILLILSGKSQLRDTLMKDLISLQIIHLPRRCRRYSQHQRCCVFIDQRGCFFIVLSAGE